MLKFADGFDQFSGQSGEGLEKSLNSSGYVAAGSMDIVEGRGDATKCLSINTGSISRMFNTTSTTVVFGFAYLAGVRSPIVEIEGVLTLNWDAEISIGENKGVAIPVIDEWYYYEIVINKVDKAITIRINDEDDLTVAMPDDVTFMRDYKIKWSSTAEAGSKLLDDFYFLDGSSGKYTQPLGPITLAIRLPSADVKTDFTPSQGDHNYAMVNNLPPEEGKNVSSNKKGDVDMYLSNDAITSADILAVGVIIRVKKSDIDNRMVSAVIGDIDGDYLEGKHETLSTGPEVKYSIFESAPDKEDWSYQTLNQSPFGIKIAN